MSAVATLPAAAEFPGLREVRLYGALGRQFGRLHRLAVRTPAEAVQALCAVLPGFDRAFLGADGQARHHLFVGRGAARNSLALDETDEPVGRTQPIRIVPFIAGCKKGGLFKVLLGAAIFFGAPWLAGAVFGAGGSVGLALGISTVGAAVGKALILGGIIDLLSPQARAADNSATEASASYNGPANVATQGGPIPLGFGRFICGSTVVSQGLSTDDYISGAAPEIYQPPALPSYQPIDPLVNLYPVERAP